MIVPKGRHHDVQQLRRRNPSNGLRVSTPAETEGQLRDRLARENLDDGKIAHKLSVVRSRLGADGRYRRSTGETISVEDVAALLVANELARQAPPAVTATEHDLAGPTCPDCGGAGKAGRTAPVDQ
jgi:hypothetical protein